MSKVARSEAPTVIDSAASTRFIQGVFPEFVSQIEAITMLGGYRPVKPQVKIFNYKQYPDDWETFLREDVHKYLGGLRPSEVGNYAVIEQFWMREIQQGLDSNKVGDFMLQLARKFNLGLLKPRRYPQEVPDEAGSSAMEYYFVNSDITRFAKHQT